MCVFIRASDDLKNNMVAVETMEQFQKELDQGKVSNMTHTSFVKTVTTLTFSENVSPTAFA